MQLKLIEKLLQQTTYYDSEVIRKMGAFKVDTSIEYEINRDITPKG